MSRGTASLRHPWLPRLAMLPKALFPRALLRREMCMHIGRGMLLRGAGGRRAWLGNEQRGG